MKTTDNNNRTIRFTAIACTAMVLGIASFAQPRPGTYNNSMIDAQKKLNAAVEMMEKSLSYETPAFNDRAAYAIYEVKLDAWGARTEEMLKYRPPSINAVEAVEIKREMKTWADNAKKGLRYEAPSMESVEAGEALSELKASAEMISQSLCYEAPSIQSVETEASRERLNVLAENAANRIRYMPPTLEEVEAGEAREYLAAFAEKTVHEALAYIPDHPAVFAFDYASPVTNHENTGEYLTLVSESR